MNTYNKKFIFSTKGGNLKQLSPHLKLSIIPECFTFTIQEWEISKKNILEIINIKFQGLPLIARSSCTSEDNDVTTNAGVFYSSNEIYTKEELEYEIEKVIKSYGERKSEEEVLIQPMINDLDYSGVAMSIDPKSGLDFWVLNIAKKSHNGVTNGSVALENIIIYKNIKNSEIYQKYKLVLEALNEVDSFLDYVPLDIEFGVKNNKFYLFQVRKIINYENSIISSKLYESIVDLNINKLGLITDNDDFFSFGVMPDWNPAEIIGIKPKKLAYSLYKRFITDEIWAYGRNVLGYNKISNKKLMHNILGSPYIDIEKSLFSLVPNSLDNNLKNKIVNASLIKLKSNKNLHDKIEFYIIPNCLTVDILKKNSILDEYDLSHKEKSLYINALTEINRNTFSTSEVCNAYNNIYQGCINFKEKDYNKYNLNDLINKIESLAADFTLIARVAFIVTSILKSLVDSQIISQSVFDNLYRSAKKISDILDSIPNINLEHKNSLIGMLRPSNYDICMPCYKDIDFTAINKSYLSSMNDFSFQKKIIDSSGDLELILRKLAIPLSEADFYSFCIKAIEQREFSKFIYSIYLSKLLNLISKFLNEVGLNNEDISHLPFNKCIDYLSNKTDISSLLESIAHNKYLWNIYSYIRSPYLIFKKEELHSFIDFSLYPTFITNKSIKSSVIEINKNNLAISEAFFDDKIVLIESADPGYDWIFYTKMSGFISCFGGENSHMAIRAREFNIPAAIGVGEELFNKLKVTNFIELDCEQKKIGPINEM